MYLADSLPSATLDELDKYLADAEEPDLDIKRCSIGGRRRRASGRTRRRWSSSNQYFAAPASSAGVERVFSAAGKMHGDLSKSAKDTTLEHSLFAAFNTD